MSTPSLELGPIRPPSEARSLLIRVTRNCPWNRCKFCRTYKGEKFGLRPLADVKQDILAAKAMHDRLLTSSSAVTFSPAECSVANWMHGGGRSAFLQDANTLIMPVDDLVQVIEFLRGTFPTISRMTTYGRSKTAAKRSVAELTRLHEAGLSRVHVGLESGYDPLLAFMDKGAAAADHIEGGRNVVESGISLSVYVVLGLGGAGMWREHAIETARVINEINPEFIRLRTLTVTGEMPLHKEIESGNFIRMTDEQIIEEEKLFIQSLDCSANLVSDHATDLLQEIEGRLPNEKSLMLAVIDRFQALSPVERAIFRMGRRLGMYYRLDDLNDPNQSEAVERIMACMGQDAAKGLDEKVICGLMEGMVRWHTGEKESLK